jgi:hypothetical protein
METKNKCVCGEQATITVGGSDTCLSCAVKKNNLTTKERVSNFKKAMRGKYGRTKKAEQRTN